MNRPLKRKLALAFMAYLDSRKTGTAFEALTMVSGAGTTLEDETAFDADGTKENAEEPAVPFLAVDVATTADTDLPGVAAFEAVLHLKTNSDDSEEGEPGSRLDADAILRDIYDVLMTPADDAAAFADGNREGEAFRTFANKPAGTDTRDTYRRPLHIYALWHTVAPTLYDGDNWHDQIVFSGHAQDMDDA